MARQTKDEAILTPTQRKKLPVRAKPYFRRLSDHLHLGYRRTATLPGTWFVRVPTGGGNYSVKKLHGVSPDDVTRPNGRDILSFDQATEAARVSLAPAQEEVTVARAAQEWSDWKCSETDSAKRQRGYRNSSKRHAAKFPDGICVGDLTAKMVLQFRDSFLDGLADADAKRARRATANRQLAELKAILNRACEIHGLSIDRPWKNVGKFPRADSFGKRLIVLTDD